MNNLMTIAKRQFLSYFNGPIAYIVLTAVLIIFGVFHWLWFFPEDRASTRLMFWLFSFFAYIAVPALTMGIIAEEKRTGTFELLVTMPVTETQVILGKFLGVFGLYAVLLALTLSYPVTIDVLGDLDWGPVFSGYVSLVLQGAALLAIGVMISSLTSSQIVAFFATLFVSVIFFVLDFAWRYLDQFDFSGATAEVVRSGLNFFAFASHLQPMQRGVIALADVFFFMSIAVACLMVAFRAIESRRWR